MRMWIMRRMWRYKRGQPDDVRLESAESLVFQCVNKMHKNDKINSIMDDGAETQRNGSCIRLFVLSFFGFL